VARLGPLPAREVVHALEQFGFHPHHQRGSHMILKHPDGRTPVVPVHPPEEIGPGLLRRITKEAGISVEELLEAV
jgi:predicted RNA binding protein YcfA (HicA-like mRNA interferase family)